MDDTIVVIVGVDFVVTGTALGLYVAIFVVSFGLKSIKGPFCIFAP